MDRIGTQKIPVDEHFRFQRRTWAIQRAGWIVLTLIAVAGLCGAFGSGGPLSTATVRNGALAVDYARFERRTVMTRLVFRFADGGEHTLHLNGVFQRSYEVGSIQPAPVRSQASAEGYDLVFASEGNAAATVTIWARPHTIGLIRIAARADKSPALDMPAFVYP